MELESAAIYEQHHTFPSDSPMSIEPSPAHASRDHLVSSANVTPADPKSLMRTPTSVNRSGLRSVGTPISAKPIVRRALQSLSEDHIPLLTSPERSTQLAAASAAKNSTKDGTNPGMI